MKTVCLWWCCKTNIKQSYLFGRKVLKIRRENLIIVMTIRSLAFRWVRCDCVYLDPKRMSKTNLVQFYSNLLYSLAKSVTQAYAHTLAKQIFHFRRWSCLGHFLILSFRVYFLLCLTLFFFLRENICAASKIKSKFNKNQI